MLVLGLAKLNQPPKNTIKGSFPEDITNLNELAKSNKNGIYSSSENTQRELRSLLGSSGQEDFATYFNENKGIMRKCVVEHIRDGANYKVCVLPSDKDGSYTFVQVQVSGIKCPGFIRGDEEKEPFAKVAKHWIAKRILNR